MTKDCDINSGHNISFDELGDYCKGYESKGTSGRAEPTSVLIARLDGRAFHGITRSMIRPFDLNFTQAMIGTTRSLVENFHAQVGYTQSDEISLAWFSNAPNYEHPFGGKFHKLNSLLAGQAAVTFNSYFDGEWSKPALFDCRTFPTPDLEIAAKVFIWRQWDAGRNAINMVAHHIFGHKSLEGVGTGDRLKRLQETNVNFNAIPEKYKLGTFILRRKVEKELSPETLAKIPESHRPSEPVLRTVTIEAVHELKYTNDPIDFLFFK
jgi:tRNA(His) 5'-end guanylyltransferase